MRKKPNVKISFFAFQDIITSTTGILILITLILTFFINADAVLGESESVEDLEEKLKKIEAKVAKTESDIAQLQKLLAEWGDADPEELQKDIEKLIEELAKLQEEINNLGEDQKASLELASKLATEQQKALELDQKIQKIKESIAEMQRRAKEAAAANLLFPTLDRELVGKKLLLVVLGRGKYEIYEYSSEGRRGTSISTFAGLENTLKSKAVDGDYQVVLFVRPSGINDFERLHGPAALGERSPLNRMGYISVGWDSLDEDAVLFDVSK